MSFEQKSKYAIIHRHGFCAYLEKSFSNMEVSMNLYTALWLTLVFVFTTSCSSSDNDSTPAIGNSFETTLELMGFITVTDSPDWEEVSIFAEFKSTDSEDLKLVRKLYGLDLAADSCNYWSHDEIKFLYDKPDNRIRAGNALSLFVENRLSMEIDYQPYPDEDDYLTYEDDSSDYPLHRLPSNSRISIPGADFPAMSDIVIPDVEAFTNLTISENGQAVDSDLIRFWDYIPSKHTNIKWHAGTSDSSFIRITAALYTSFDEDGEVNYVNCIAKDDGDFKFPETAHSYFENKTVAILNISRESLTSYLEGSAGLIVIHDSESDSEF